MAFESLSDKLTAAFKKLRGKGRLTQADIKEAMREVRLALLEADVSYKVVKDFTKSVTERASGGETVFEVRVADGDMGKVIGRQGRIVKEIRILMRAVAQKQGKKVSVDIMD